MVVGWGVAWALFTKRKGKWFEMDIVFYRIPLNLLSRIVDTVSAAMDKVDVEEGKRTSG